jgi:dTDP-4-amino-4,6-dideoxygalactose transaminase
MSWLSSRNIATEQWDFRSCHDRRFTSNFTYANQENYFCISMTSNQKPAFPEPLYVGRPNIGDRRALMDRIDGILDRRWLTNHGPVIREFEERIASLLGVKHCVAMSNATVALEIASRAVGLEGEVIIPSFTFIATAHALQWQGITPVFADIDPKTHSLDPSSVESLVTPKTTGIVGVHLWGRACDTEALQAIASKHGLKLMYDASHAFACSHNGKMIGNFGACEVFSFHATKFLNCFEGGAVVTNDCELAEKMRLMRNFGFKGFDNVIYLGVNGKMTEVCAAMGLTSIEAMPEILEVNQRNYHAYRQRLDGNKDIGLLAYDERERNNFQYIVACLAPHIQPMLRDRIVATLHANNVIARKYFWPGCHKMEPYRTLQPDAGKHLPATEATGRRIIVLPTGQTVTEPMIAAICRIVLNSLGG